VPVPQVDNASGGGVDLPQPGVGLLADDGVGVLVRCQIESDPEER